MEGVNLLKALYRNGHLTAPDVGAAKQEVSNARASLESEEATLSRLRDSFSVPTKKPVIGAIKAQIEVVAACGKRLAEYECQLETAITNSAERHKAEAARQEYLRKERELRGVELSTGWQVDIAMINAMRQNEAVAQQNDALLRNAGDPRLKDITVRITPFKEAHLPLVRDS